MKIFAALLFNFICLTVSGASIDFRDMISGPYEEFYPLQEFQIQNRRMDQLPLEGRATIEKSYGYQWYTIYGGIDFDGFSEGLSPGEKYERITGKRIGLDHFSNRFSTWAGYCNGVANLHAIAEVPQENQFVSLKDGSQLELTPTDVHALASLAMTEISLKANLMGIRCNQSFKRGDACKGMNAGAFHLALANILGNEKKPFVADVQRSLKVNNLPIFSYRSTLSETSLGTLRMTNYIVQKMKTTIEVPVVVKNRAESPISNKTTFITYEYLLYLATDTNEIMGGKWLSKQRPDFIWRPVCERFEGELEFLNKMLDWKC